MRLTVLSDSNPLVDTHLLDHFVSGRPGFTERKAAYHKIQPGR